MEIVKQQDLKTIRNRSQYIKYDGTEYVHDQFNTYTWGSLQIQIKSSCPWYAFWESEQTNKGKREGRNPRL